MRTSILTSGLALMTTGCDGLEGEPGSLGRDSAVALRETAASPYFDGFLSGQGFVGPGEEIFPPLAVDVDPRVYQYDGQPFAGLRHRGVERLGKRFREEAYRQVALAEAAGGWCNLPDDPILADEAPVFCEGWGCPDVKLGGRLHDLSEVARIEWGKFAVAREQAGQEDAHLTDWRANIGKGECNPVAPLPEQPALDALVGQFNHLCAESHGGHLTTQLERDPLAVHRLLVERGKRAMEALTPREANLARATWVAACRPGAVPEELTATESQQFLGSVVPMEVLTGATDGSTEWRCPDDESDGIDLNGGFERNTCGVVAKWVVEPGAPVKNGKQAAHLEVVAIPPMVVEQSPE